MFKGVSEKAVGLYVAMSSRSRQCMNNVMQLVWSHREGPSSEPDVYSPSKEQPEDFFPFRKWQLNQERT